MNEKVSSSIPEAEAVIDTTPDNGQEGRIIMPEAERARISKESKKEEAWYSGEPFSSWEEVEVAVNEGLLVPVADSDHYKVSANAVEGGRYLTPVAKKMLDLVAGEWSKKMKRKGEDIDSLFLIVTSMTRIVSYQDGLSKKGFPTADSSNPRKSTHLRGGTFDLAFKWLKENRSVAYKILLEVLRDLHKKEQINLIEETTIGVLHVCVNPDKAKRRSSSRRLAGTGSAKR